MVRSYSPKTKSRRELLKDMETYGITQTHIDEAREILDRSLDWHAYLKSLREGLPVSSLSEQDKETWPGAFMSARRLQRQAANASEPMSPRAH